MINKNKKVVLKILSLFFITSMVFGIFYSVIAAEPSTTTPSSSSSSSKTKTYEAQIKSPIGEVTAGELIGRIVEYLMGLVGVIAVLMLIWGGVMYMTSAGNEEKINTAKKIITGAIIGLVVALLAYLIVDQVIKALTGAGAS